MNIDWTPNDVGAVIAGLQTSRIQAVMAHDLIKKLHDAIRAEAQKEQKKDEPSENDSGDLAGGE